MDKEISYVIIEAIGKKHLEKGVATLQCEKDIVFGMLSGVLMRPDENNINVPFLVLTSPKGDTVALNLNRTNIISLEMSDYVTRELCIYRDLKEDQKLAQDTIFEIMKICINRKMMHEGTSEFIDIEKFFHLPVAFKTEANALVQRENVVTRARGQKSTSHEAVGGHSEYYSDPGRNINYVPKTNSWKPVPTFFKRSEKTLEKAHIAIEAMKKKVQEIADGLYRAPEITEPENKPFVVNQLYGNEWD